MTAMDNFRVIIPARFASTRLPGKVLLDIAGKPMIQHVYERALESAAQSVVIATDHPDVKAVAESFGANVCMTSPDHPSGSARLAEAVDILNYPADEIVVNVQGDEPIISPQVIRQLAEDLCAHKERNVVATLYEYLNRKEDLWDPAIVKTVLDHEGYALYFSRSPIPWVSETVEEIPLDTYLRHVGIYAYRAGFLKQYVQWSRPMIEEKESLEQLRILWQGGRVHLTRAKESVPAGVNTLEDLGRIRKLFEKA